MVRAVQAQLAVAEGGVDKSAMMRARRVVVAEGPEESARNAHPSDRDTALLLKRANHRDEGAQECGLLRGRQFANRLQQKVGPGGSGRRLTTPVRRQHNDHPSTVARSTLLGYQALAMQGGDAVRGRGGGDP